ncbi:MAG: hypothetical protein IT247_00810 [Bacteroidia bacterium]|nr:hypothetical protein [Bacteroidia bacterium]
MERTDSVLHKFDIDKNKVINVFSLSPEFGRIDDFSIENDTIYALKYPYGEIVIQSLYDPSSRAKYSLNTKDEMLGYSIEMRGNFIYVQSFPSHILNSVEKIISYYKKPLDNLIQMTNGRPIIKQRFGPFPELYYTGKHPDCVNGPRCLDDSTILYSFAYSDHVQEYNLAKNTIKEIAFSSNTFKAPPDFDFSQYMNLDYTNKYWNQVTSFANILYNPWKKKIYRIMNLPVGNFSKLPFNNPWSILVGTKEKGVSLEIHFPPLEYRNHNLIPTKKGFAIPCLPKNKKDTSNIILHEFKVN